MDKAIHRVSHIEINPASSRIVFLHRWTERIEDETCFLHRLITMDPDGGRMRLNAQTIPCHSWRTISIPAAVGTYDYEKSEYQISHPLWRDDRTIIVWGRIRAASTTTCARTTTTLQYRSSAPAC
jgi:hypothetical protein